MHFSVQTFVKSHSVTTDAWKSIFQFQLLNVKLYRKEDIYATTKQFVNHSNFSRFIDEPQSSMLAALLRSCKYSYTRSMMTIWQLSVANQKCATNSGVVH